jgi:hypothetical protein
MMINKRPLQGVKGIIPAQSLDRCDLSAFHLDGEYKAGVNRLTIDQYGTGAAIAMIAATLGPRQAKLFP